MLGSILGNLPEGSEAFEHPLLARREEKRILAILVTGDKGLCGAFNSNVIKAAQHFLRQRAGASVEVEFVGRKGRDFFKTRDVAFSITGSATRQQVAQPENPEVKRGPGGIQLLDLRLVIPPVDCQRVLDAIPKEMAPYMAGYKVRGVFDTDVKLAIDWDRLDDVELGGHVGYKHCKITSEPADSAKRLLKALVLAEEFVVNHQEQTKSIIARKWDMDAELINETWHGTRLFVSFSQSIVTALQNYSKWARDQEGKTGEPPNVWTYLDLGPLEQLDPQLVTVFR